MQVTRKRVGRVREEPHHNHRYHNCPHGHSHAATAATEKPKRELERELDIKGRANIEALDERCNRLSE